MDVKETIDACFDLLLQRIKESPERALDIAEAARQTIVTMALIGVSEAIALRPRVVQAQWLNELEHVFE